MIRLLLIMPYEELIPIMEQYLQTQDICNVEVDITHIYGTNADLGKISKYHIVAARGITGKYIKKMLPEINLVEIPMTSDDVICALNKSIETYGRTETAVILPDTEVCNITQLAELTKLMIRPYYVNTQEDVRVAIDSIQRHGISAIIGGLTVCSRCKELGLSAVQLKTGSEAIKRTIQVALNAAETLRKEHEKSNLITTILNSSRDAIVALDRDGFVMTSNTQANAFFRQYGNGEQPLANKHIKEIFPEWDRGIVNQTQHDSDVLVTIGNQLILLHQTPIVIDAITTGVLITLQKAEQIRESETKIRKQLAHKGMTAKYHFGNIIGVADAIRRCIATAYKYSTVNSNVLILGETGTGKELFAQSIHNASSRRAEPFVAVNCAALPEQLLESELFGYSDGAFSGAIKGGKLGLFELAHKGTIFLDEIGEMPTSLQAKLLRVLQEKEIRRIGDDKVIPIDVRVISATNVSIREKVQKGEFRADLYYRINLLNLEIPPLRNRREDIGILFQYFVDNYSKKSNIIITEVTPDALGLLSTYHWFGNIRELKNFSERVVVLCEGGRIDRQLIEEIGTVDQAPFLELSHSVPAGESKQYLEKQDLVDDSNLTREELAQMLGISRTTLWRRMKKHKLDIID